MSIKKTVLITGCSEGGIGYALCREFLSRDYHVFATARTPSKMNDLNTTPNVTPLKLDVADPKSIAEAVEAVKLATKNGTLDVLINNSAVTAVNALVEVPMDEARWIFDTNVWGPLMTVQGFTPLLLKTKGCIVNISSIVSTSHYPWMGIYSASKAALDCLSGVLRYELEAFGVRVINVHTGAIETGYSKNIPDYELPLNSMYKSIKGHLSSVADGTNAEMNKGRSSPADYARQVANDVEAKVNKDVWHGTASTIFWLLACMPYWLVSMFVKSTAEVNTLIKNVKTGEAMQKKRA